MKQIWAYSQKRGLGSCLDGKGLSDCSRPEPLGKKSGLALFDFWQCYLGFVNRITSSPLMPENEADHCFDRLQAGYLFLMIGVDYLVAPAFFGPHLGPVDSSWSLATIRFNGRLFGRNGSRQNWTKAVYVLNTWRGSTFDPSAWDSGSRPVGYYFFSSWLYGRFSSLRHMAR